MDGAIRSIKRCFEIFALFERERRELSPTEIARALDTPLSSTVELLRSMGATGYLTYDSVKRCYFPSLQFGILGQWIHTTVIGDTTLTAAAAEIREALGETVCITGMNDLESQFLVVLQGQQSITLSVVPGSTVPVFSTAVGRAMLASWPDKAVRTFVSRYNRRSGKGAVVAEDVLAQVAADRAAGYAEAYGAAVEGAGAIAVAVQVDSARQLVVSVGGPIARIRERRTEIIATMRKIIKAHRHIDTD